MKASDCKNLVGQDTGRQTLSHTRLSMFLNCPQRWDWYYRKRLELISKPEPLEMGRAFHEAIEGGDPELGADLIYAGHNPRSQEDEDKLITKAAIVVCASRAYLKRWGKVPGEVNEYEYRVQLRSPWTGYYSRSFDLVGFADAVSFDGGECELVENKLVGQISSLSIRRLPLDRQVSLSCYAIWRSTATPVTKVRYRFTRKPSIRPRQNETTHDYVKRLEQDYYERPDFYLHEEILYRSPEDMERIEQELWVWAEHIRVAQSQDFTPRNTSFCHEYGGCAFIPLCVGDPDAMSLYQTRPEHIDNPEEAEDVSG